MKIIRKSELRKAISKEYKEARAFCRSVRGGTYRMMLDTRDARIWVDMFVDQNSWAEYQAAEICQLYCPAPSLRTVEERIDGYLEDAVEGLMKAGWIIDP